LIISDRDVGGTIGGKHAMPRPLKPQVALVLLRRLRFPSMRRSRTSSSTEWRWNWSRPRNRQQSHERMRGTGNETCESRRQTYCTNSLAIAVLKATANSDRTSYGYGSTKMLRQRSPRSCFALGHHIAPADAPVCWYDYQRYRSFWRALKPRQVFFPSSASRTCRTSRANRRGLDQRWTAPSARRRSSVRIV
jgi:hypothetical protein